MTSTSNSETRASFVPTTPSATSLTQQSTLQGSNAGGSRISVNDALPITDQSKSGASSHNDKPILSFLERPFALEIINSANAKETKHWAQQARREKRNSEASENSKKD